MPGATLHQVCAFLNVGQTFVGTQNVPQNQGSAKDEAWKVNVRIQGCNLEQGYLCGSMEALNVQSTESSVVTFWEGEIVDNKNHTFFTGQWNATKDNDLKHWAKFASFAPIMAEVERDGGLSVDLANYDHMFMRWKEQFFVNVNPDCGLTIAGFYYVCFSRRDGTIQGFYYDPHSTPFQKLELKPALEGQQGHSLGIYQFR
ncbi:hypothetical protein CBR_g30417 [Chara braunii]|uniref:Glucose-induced degradation protein 4 homolog n=1 Tax=Chara braunii TaxID=69332 RepID=A0A388LCL4_CHABU|nr:hypothetical protein CBR_g30417 [Chara braunii]|eukprot:GBG80051.1 hypothetical protein CBR_g30417 [Chara braunii]